MNIIPNVPPKTFTFSAVAIGYILISDLTTSEQNALGNWLMLVAQVLCTNAYYQELRHERNGLNQQNNSQNLRNDDKDTIAMLEKMLNALEKEIFELKKKI